MWDREVSHFQTFGSEVFLFTTNSAKAKELRETLAFAHDCLCRFGKKEIEKEKMAGDSCDIVQIDINSRKLSYFFYIERILLSLYEWGFATLIYNITSHHFGIRNHQKYCACATSYVYNMF
jgi:hypothetical protein